MKRLLIDENIPRQLAPLFHDAFQVTLVYDSPWAGAKNGELVRAITGNVDILLTCDQSIRYQQNLSALSFGIVVLAGRSNRLDDLLPLVGTARLALERVRAGEVVEVRASTT